MKVRGGLTFEDLTMAIARITDDYKEVNDWSVDNWLNFGKVPSEFKHLPKAIEAQKILNSELYNAMKEEE